MPSIFEREDIFECHIFKAKAANFYPICCPCYIYCCCLTLPLLCIDKTFVEAHSATDSGVYALRFRDTSYGDESLSDFVLLPVSFSNECTHYVSKTTMKASMVSGFLSYCSLPCIYREGSCRRVVLIRKTSLYNRQLMSMDRSLLLSHVYSDVEELKAHLLAGSTVQTLLTDALATNPMQR